MMPSRLEVDFNRLLCRMEEMADSRLSPDDWRFEKYLNALRQQVNELGRDSTALRPAPEQLKHYRDKVDFLEKLWASCRAASVEERSTLAATLSVPAAPPSALTEPEPASVRHRAADIAARSRAAVNAEMREQLLGGGDSGGRHEEEQERLTEGMIDLARTLKETAATAGKVVRADIAQVEATSRVVEGNTERLATEGKRLERLASASAAVCSCTVWLGLVLVTFAFVSMVVFIRLFPKR